MAEPHEAAKWRVDDTRDDAPVREPMNGKGTKPAQRRKPDTDQKKVRRELARSAYVAQDFAKTVMDEFDRRQEERHGSPAKSWDMADSSDRHGGSGDAGGESVSQSMSASPSAGSGSSSSATASLPGIEHAGDRECEACGQVGAPVLADTGPTCAACGSYSLKRSPHKNPLAAAVATRLDTNVATSQGQILMKAGDQIKTPTGQALTVRNIRRHETSRDHYYVDTDAGTTLVNWQTNFTLVPDNQSQQHLPGTGTPGGNFAGVPSMDAAVDTSAPNLCPACGAKGTLNRQGQSYKCSRCGYSDKNVGGGQNYSDATQQFAPTSSRKTAGAIATRAQSVLDHEEENPS